MPVKLLAAAIALAIALPALAEDAPIGPKPGVVVLHCGHVFDAAAGKLIGETTIVAEGKRIREVRPGFADPDSLRGTGQPASFASVDLKNATCLPGLIDAHTHLTGQTSPTGYTDRCRWNTADYASRSTVYARRTLDAGTSLRLSLASDLWTAKCAPNQLENALLNLVINARDAIPAGGTLTIATRNVSFEAPLSEQGAKPGRYVGLAVTDTGVGMDAETVRRAFEPFFTTKAMGQGTGLGLSMVYGFARQSEGYAAIDSAPGDGTTFHLYLPYHAAALEPETAPDGPCLTAVAEVGEVVLVVEDEAIVRTLVVDQLRELGYHVLQAADGPEGVDILNSSQVINLLLTDIGLPGMNGRLVAQAGRTCRPDLPILFMTGYAETATQAAGFLEAGMGLITKPFEMEALAQRVRDTMTQAPLRAEAPSGPAKAPI